MTRRATVLATLVCVLLLAACREEDPNIAQPVNVDADGNILAVDLIRQEDLPGGSHKVENVDPDTGRVLARGWKCGDKLVGPWVYYHADGKIPSHAGTYRIGATQDGVWTDYYPNGRPEAITTFTFGVREGQYLAYHDNGQRKSRGEYYQNQRVGKWVGWHANGRVECVGNYREGKPYGLWLFYNERGVEVGRQNYYLPGAVRQLETKDEQSNEAIIPTERR